jgi:inositol phosphorylceramide mannosyltransferase catalytic subunit
VQQCIPKRIIQTGRSRDLQPVEMACVANVQLLNPEFEYLFFDNQDVEIFVDSHFPEYREVFDSFPAKIQKYDFFRYLAIYHYGGYYLDLDVLLCSSLSELPAAGSLFSFECLMFSRLLRERHGMDWQIGNYAFGATKGHPFLKAVIDNCVRAQREPAWAEAAIPGVPFLSKHDYRVLGTTGPILLTRTLAEDPVGDIAVLFPDDVCDRREWFRFGDKGIHLMSGTWRGGKGGLANKAALYSEAVHMKRLTRDARGRGPTRSHPAIRILTGSNFAAARPAAILSDAAPHAAVRRRRA